MTDTQQITKQLNWRAAVKQYDSSKKLTDEQVALLTEVARMAPSSFGLQPYSLIVVSDPEQKAQLRAAAYGQPQLTDASHIFVLTHRKTIAPADIDAYVQRIAAQRGVSKESLEEYAGMMLGSTQSLTPDQQAAWSAKQAYTVLGMLLAVAMQLEIDTTPMEGFDKKAFDQILGLENSEYQTAVILTAGFRATDDKYSTMTKVRKDNAEFVTHAQPSKTA